MRSISVESPDVLEVEGIHTYRGGSYVLQGLSLTANDGACTTVLGRNGMGKTTLVRSVMGLSPPRSGSIRFHGTELAGLPAHAVARLGVAVVPQGRRLFPSLTLEENLTLAARDGAWTLRRVYDLFPALEERRAHRGRELSGGEQQMAAIGRALLANPRFVLMDEPSEGLAPRLVETLRDVIATLREDGLSILLVEQNYALGLASADRVFVVANGIAVWDGTPAELERSDDIRHTHLGI